LFPAALSYPLPLSLFVRGRQQVSLYPLTILKVLCFAGTAWDAIIGPLGTACTEKMTVASTKRVVYTSLN